MKITGEMLIGASAVRGTDATLRAGDDGGLVLELHLRSVSRWLPAALCRSE